MTDSSRNTGIQGRESPTFIEVDKYQVCKHGQHLPGDVFFSEKNRQDKRTIMTLSDGLGSGVKADVLATLTATMATKFVASDIPVKRAAEIIMNTLPVDKDRGISYATFTIVDIEPNAVVRIIEYDNPPYLLVRRQTVVEPIKDMTEFRRKNARTAPHVRTVISYTRYEARPGDRLIFFSDGVTQSGMGSPLMPFGWGIENVQEFVLSLIRDNPEISARELAQTVVQEALIHDGFAAKDDISCGVVYFRNPRDTLVITGPAFDPKNDREMADIFTMFNGKKVISGGTTANILARELDRKISVVMKNLDRDVPPYSEMEGADLVCEGIITLCAAADLLESGASAPPDRDNAAIRMTELFRNSDRIYFVVGTKINEAHQDPNMPEGLEIRRNVVKKLASLLEEKYLKEVYIQYL